MVICNSKKVSGRSPTALRTHLFALERLDVSIWRSGLEAETHVTMTIVILVTI